MARTLRGEVSPLHNSIMIDEDVRDPQSNSQFSYTCNLGNEQGRNWTQ